MKISTDNRQLWGEAPAEPKEMSGLKTIIEAAEYEFTMYEYRMMPPWPEPEPDVEPGSSWTSWRVMFLEGEREGRKQGLDAAFREGYEFGRQSCS